MIGGFRTVPRTGFIRERELGHRYFLGRELATVLRELFRRVGDQCLWSNSRTLANVIGEPGGWGVLLLTYDNARLVS